MRHGRYPYSERYLSQHGSGGGGGGIGTLTRDRLMDRTPAAAAAAERTIVTVCA